MGKSKPGPLHHAVITTTKGWNRRRKRAGLTWPEAAELGIATKEALKEKPEQPAA